MSQPTTSSTRPATSSSERGARLAASILIRQAARSRREPSGDQILRCGEQRLSSMVCGRCWLNPPYVKLKKMAATGEFVSKLLCERSAGRVTAAILLTGPGIAARWFREAAGQACAILPIRGRLSFNRPDGSVKSPTRGNVIFYFGDHLEAFRREFADLGTLLTRTEFAGCREATINRTSRPRRRWRSTRTLGSRGCQVRRDVRRLGAVLGQFNGGSE